MARKQLALLLLAICSASVQGWGQITGPVIVWDHSYGGGSNDYLFSIDQTDDGGFIVGGFSNSQTDGTKTAPALGGYDYWVVRIDSEGQPLWDRTFGGTEDDFLQVCRRTADGGIILGGTSLSSTNGNKESPQLGLRDYWIVRLDAAGAKIWEHSYGGSGSDYFQDLVQTADGGFLVGGYSLSGNDGNKTSPTYGFHDYWIVRLDASGDKLWDRSFGGASSDYLVQIQIASHGGFALGGHSLSDTNGSRTSPRIGDRDYWFLLVDTNGLKTFEAAFGGSGDNELLSMRRTLDNGFILGGRSTSGLSGNKTSPNFGQDDFWVVKLDAAGQKLWDKSFGGSGRDVLWSAGELPDRRLVLGGWSDSPTNGTKTSRSFGKSDYWVVGTDAEGNLEWDRSYGGNEDEVVLALESVNAAGVLLGGYSFTGVQGGKTAPNFGANDFWLVKIIAENPAAIPHLQALPQSISDLRGLGFRSLLLGQSNRSYVVEFSTNLVDWRPFATNHLLDSQTQVLDSSATNRQQRFYRAILQQ